MSNRSNIENGVLEGPFFYTQIRKADTGGEYGTAWKVSVAVSTEVAKEWNRKYKKQTAKMLDNEEFTEKFKADTLPYPDQEFQFVIMLAKKTHLASGEETPARYRPRAYLQKGKTALDITETTNIGNGSKGLAKFSHFDHPKYGAIAHLMKVLVTDLVEYEESDEGESAYGVDDLLPGLTVEGAPEPAPAKPTGKGKPAKEEFQDDDLPF